LTKNLITINQFIKQSLGEWKSIRSTHTLAFQEVENTTSKILIDNIGITNKKVDQLLKAFDSGTQKNSIAISVKWHSISDWEEDRELNEDQTILVFIPKNNNTGIVLRNKGYIESILSSSEYFLDNNANLILKTIYNSTVSEERICFLSKHIRARYSVIRHKDNNSIIQTSHASEIRNISNIKD